MAHPDTLTKLMAVVDEFYQALAEFEDPTKRLVESWTGIRQHYVEPSGTPRSALAAGMDQGLRESPLLLQSKNLEVRKRAV